MHVCAHKHTHKLLPHIPISQDHVITCKGIYHTVNSDRKVIPGPVAKSGT